MLVGGQSITIGTRAAQHLVNVRIERWKISWESVQFFMNLLKIPKVSQAILVVDVWIMMQIISSCCLKRA